jgi:tRNA-dihydrouridine synthase B
MEKRAGGDGDRSLAVSSKARFSATRGALAADAKGPWPILIDTPMLRIGSIQLDLPVVQAALSGYSDAPMRLMARRFGAPYCIHEVVLDKLVVQRGKFQKRLLTVPEADHPVGGQLMGSEPEQFSAAAAWMADAGYDVIDINFGCPVKKVLGRCRGGYLLSEPETAVEIIQRVRDAVPPAKPVTLKMRRGMDDSAKSERNFFRIFDAALDAGLAAITVHGRTVAQKYVGPSNWAFLKRVKQHAGERTVLGSGDLFTAEDVVAMLAETAVDGVTVARGCIGNPWIFREARALLAGEPLPPPPSLAEQALAIRDHFELTLATHGEQLTPRIMRKFGIKYAQWHPHFEAVRDAFAQARSSADWRAVLDSWYDPARQWPPVVRRSHGDLATAGVGG